MPEKITIEKLAEMSQHKFSAIRSEVAGGFTRVHEEADSFRKDVDHHFDMLAEVPKAIRDDVKEIKSDATTINFDYVELRTRIDRLEKKAGLK